MTWSLYENPRHSVGAELAAPAAMPERGVPNLERHIYGRGGIPFGSWPQRYLDWFRDLGFLGKPGVGTKAARDVEASRGK